jgi:hypothetical protein
MGVEISRFYKMQFGYNFRDLQKSQNLKCILDKSLLNKKVVFLQKLIKIDFKGCFGQKLHDLGFSFRPNDCQSSMWLPYTSNVAQKGLKASRIAKCILSESFVEITLTVWKLCPEKWQWGLMSASTPFWDHCGVFILFIFQS